MKKGAEEVKYGSVWYNHDNDGEKFIFRYYPEDKSLRFMFEFYAEDRSGVVYDLYQECLYWRAGVLTESEAKKKLLEYRINELKEDIVQSKLLLEEYMKVFEELG